MRNIPKSAGIGLLVYGIGVTAAFMAIGAPGGDYEPAGVAGYVAAGHWPAAFALSYLAALASFGLMVFGQGLRVLGGTVGELVWGAAVAGTATSVVGAFVTGGLDVAMAEGGRSVQAGVPHPVVYAITEIGNLLCVCGPAFFAGVIAVVLAVRAPLPGWLRVFSCVAGVCGILAPFYFTYFVFVLWAIVAGVFVSTSRTEATEPAVVVSSAGGLR
jgi:hypothetical protein